MTLTRFGQLYYFLSCLLLLRKGCSFTFYRRISYCNRQTSDTPSAMPKIVYATTDSDEEDYARKLQQAQTAIQEAEEARLKMLQKKKKSVGSIPLLTRCKISKTDAGTLQIDIQPEGIKSSSLFSGAFSVAWFSAIIPATFAGGGPGGALFLLPFWMAGVWSPRRRWWILLSRERWPLDNTLGHCKANMPNHSRSKPKKVRPPN